MSGFEIGMPPPIASWCESGVISITAAGRKASVTMKPASGPAIPMSKSAFRFGIGSRIRMKAPKVPGRRLTPKKAGIPGRK